MNCYFCKLIRRFIDIIKIKRYQSRYKYLIIPLSIMIVDPVLQQQFNSENSIQPLDKPFFFVNYLSLIQLVQIMIILLSPNFHILHFSSSPNKRSSLSGLEYYRTCLDDQRLWTQLFRTSVYDLFWPLARIFSKIFRFVQLEYARVTMAAIYPHSNSIIIAGFLNSVNKKNNRSNKERFDLLGTCLRATEMENFRLVD